MRLEIRGLTKKFGTFTANDDIDLVVEPGEIHCLLGENGAGKSTLMNMLYGLVRPTSGEIFVDGEEVDFTSPADALGRGIGMVHQHFMLVPVFTVAENVALGLQRAGGGARRDGSRRAGRRRTSPADRVRELSRTYGLAVEPDAVVEQLPVGVQQRVEILKALTHDAEVLILDEPTAVLTPQETDELFAIMRTLKAEGTSIIFITHKLREVREIADRISVIRRGKVVGSTSPSASQDELAELMVGRKVSLVVDKTPAAPGPAALEARGLVVRDPRGLTVVDDVSLEARAGEVLCIAGVQGNGQTELVATLLGLSTPDAGSVLLDGEDVTRVEPRRRLERGLGFVPEDRGLDGYVGDFSVGDNLVLDLFRSKGFSRAGALDLEAIANNAERRIEEFDIRTPSAQTPVSSLSGGNQQKVVVARELSRPLTCLVASQPTRGVDVGSIEFIHRRIVAERDRGTAVVIVSTELDEVYALADRIAVMYDGRVVAVVGPDTPREELGLLMAGGRTGGDHDRRVEEVPA